MTGEGRARRRAEWLAGLRGPDGREPEPWEVRAAEASMDAWDAAEREGEARAAAAAERKAAEERARAGRPVKRRVGRFWRKAGRG